MRGDKLQQVIDVVNELPKEKVIADGFYVGHLLIFKHRNDKILEIGNFKQVVGEEIIELAIRGVKSFYSELQQKLAEKHLVGKRVNISSRDSGESLLFCNVIGIQNPRCERKLFDLSSRNNSHAVAISEKMKIQILGDIPPIRYA